MKLAIISHTEHYKTADGTIVGWGPTISEINHLAEDFEEIYHVAVLHEGTPPPSSLPYTKSNIHFVPLKPSGGKSIGDKLKILTTIPNVISTVRKTLKKVDVFQLRTPTGMGVFLIPYLTFFVKKKGWYKYAGNWNQENPPLGYRLQRAMLKAQKRKVTINGKWPNQPSHCLTFENPCLTLEEREEGKQVLAKKEFKPPFTLCFVGRLEDAKGVHRILEALTNLDDRSKISTVHLIGDGPKADEFKKIVIERKLPIKFHGFLDRKNVFEWYKRSQVFLLPSDSEGFPKVVAEAMNFGCIPMVSDVSSIGQYVTPSNGYLINPLSSATLVQLLADFMTLDSPTIKKMALEGRSLTDRFTFAHYRDRIWQEIVAT